MLRVRSLAVVLVLAAPVVVRVLDLRGSAPTASPAVAGSPVAATTGAAPQDGISTLSAAAKFSPILVSLAGQVTRSLPGGDFLVNNGQADYIVAMSSDAKVVNRNGGEVGRQLIHAGEPVRITGTLNGMRITSPTVVLASVDSQP
jgi:hypothetical protein